MGEELTAAAAVRYIRTSRWLPPLLGLALVMNLLVLGPFFVMLPWRVTSQHLPTVSLGLAVSLQAGAALLASLATGRHPPARPGRRFAVMATAFPAALLVLTFLPGMPGVLLAAALTGAGMASGVLENLMLQTWVPDRLRGRVYSFDVLVSLCAIPLGYLLAGAAIDTGTAQAVAAAGAALCLAVAAAAAASPLAPATTLPRPRMPAPDTAADYLARALRYDRAGREAQAVPDYQQALKPGLDPADQRIALISLASSHRTLGQLDQAQTVINTARRKYPHDPVVDAFAALILLEAGQPRRAIRVLGLALCEHAKPGALAGFDTALAGTSG